MKRIKGFLNKKKVCIVLIVLLLISTVYYANENYDKIHTEKYLEKFPHLPLVKSVYISRDKCPYVTLTGFVAFDDLKKQPRSIKQYQVIESEGQCSYDKKYPDYYLTNFYKMKWATIEKEYKRDKLTVVSDDSRAITLIDEYKNIYTIGKESGMQVHGLDAQGDKTKLITNEVDFSNFIERWQKIRNKTF